MKKFIIKALLFSWPIVFLFLFTLVFYATNKGDLVRVGYIIDKADYRNVFKEELERENFYTKVSSVNLNSPKKYTVLTIGNSFSEQKGFGCKNYLAQKSTISVLHLDRFLSGNPIQTLYGFLNSNVLDKIKVNYIILQSVEREFVTRGKSVDPTKKK